MNVLVYFLSILISMAAVAKTVIIKERAFDKMGDPQLLVLVRQTMKERNILQSDSPPATERLLERIRRLTGLSAEEKNSIVVERTNPDGTTTRVTGSGSVLGGTGTGSGTGSGSGAGTDTSQSEQEIPDAPPAPDAPPVGTSPATSSPLTKPQPTEEDYILVELSSDELRGLTPQEKSKSDELVWEVIKKLMYEVFTGGEKTVRPEAYKKIPPLATSYDAYRFFLKDTLMALGKKSAFKKRAELRNVLGLKSEEKKLDSFLNAKLSAEDVANKVFLKQLYKAWLNNEKTIIKEFALLISPLFFDVSDMTELENSLEVVLTNLAISLRQVQTPSDNSRVLSDILVEEVFAWVLDHAKEDLDKKDNPGLSRDYIRILFRQISLLRLQPAFFKFQGLTGSVAREREQRQTNQIQKLKLYPILDLLSTTDISLLDYNKIMYAVDGQLLFEPDDFILRDVRNRDESKLLLEKILQAHKARIIAQRGTINIYELLQQLMVSADSVKKISEGVALLEKTVGAKDEITRLKAELKKLVINPDEVITLLKALAKQNTLSFENQVRKAIESHLKEADSIIKSIEILNAAKAKYDPATKGYLDSFVLEQLKARKKEIKNPARMNEAIKRFTALDRTPDGVGRIFNYNLQVTNLGTYAKKEDFRKWFHPYALLLETLKTVPPAAKEVASEGVQAQLDVLTKSLEALNTGVIANAKYALAFSQYKEEILAGVLKNKLTSLVEALKQRDIPRFSAQVKSFVADAGLKIEESAEFKNRIEEIERFVINLMLADLINNLTALNTASGKYQVPGLSIKPRETDRNLIPRNLQVYKQLKGAFDSLLALLNPSGKPLTVESLMKEKTTLEQWNDRLEKAMKDTFIKIDSALASKSLEDKYPKNKPVEEQKKEIRSLLEQYLKSIWNSSGPEGEMQRILKQVMLLKQQAGEEVKEDAPSSEVPSLEEGIPAPPPPPGSDEAGPVAPPPPPPPAW